MHAGIMRVAFLINVKRGTTKLYDFFSNHLDLVNKICSKLMQEIFLCLIKTNEYLCYEVLNCITYTVHAREECIYNGYESVHAFTALYTVFPKKKSSFENIIFFRSSISET